MLQGIKASILAAVAAIATVGAAEAQNYNLRPVFGTVTLNAGFLPDPYVRSGLQAGGDNHFGGSGGCPGGGWFANRPDFRLHYRAGGYRLTIYAMGPHGTDIMLLVNDPGTTWYCNDDAHGPLGLDPLIQFSNPQSGQYDIWIGTYNRARVPGSAIYITENL